MKNLLVITHLAHASPRIPTICKYLPEYSWQPIILTPKTNIKVSNKIKLYETQGYESPYGQSHISAIRQKFFRRYLSKLYRFYKEINEYPDRELGWEKHVYITYQEIESELEIEQQEIDVMLSSSSPIISHIIASNIKEKFNIPWVADFRDLWTQNHNYPFTRIRKHFERKLELKTLTNSNILTTVSEPLAKSLRELHKKPVETVTNGFDPELYQEDVNLTEKFTITYTGQIYEHKQNVELFLKAIHSLIKSNVILPENIEIRFYGETRSFLLSAIKTHHLGNITHCYESIPKQEIIRKQKESHLLLFLNWEDKKESGIYSTKLFEYFVSKRSIITTGGHTDSGIQELLEQTNTGQCCYTLDEIKQYIKQQYYNYKIGKLVYNGNEAEINKFSYKEKARQLSEILNTLI